MSYVVSLYNNRLTAAPLYARAKKILPPLFLIIGATFVAKESRDQGKVKKGAVVSRSKRGGPKESLLRSSLVMTAGSLLLYYTANNRTHQRKEQKRTEQKEEQKRTTDLKATALPKEVPKPPTTEEIEKEGSSSKLTTPVLSQENTKLTYAYLKKWNQEAFKY